MDTTRAFPAVTRVAAPVTTVIVNAELVEVLAEDGHQLRRDRDGAPLVFGTVLQAAIVVRLSAVRPSLVRLGLGLREHQAAPSGLRKVTVLLTEAERFGREKAYEVEAGEEGTKVPATGYTARIGHRGEQFPSLDRVGDYPPVLGAAPTCFTGFGSSIAFPTRGGTFVPAKSADTKSGGRTARFRQLVSKSMMRC
ncbi:hypothetical protein [Microtetraspora malaysiensis]|uniref:hypothetical protein n=1 Tax=Microtetraspora malaysiensis TaxID=161358 RepID=UPI003D8F86D8